MALKNTRNSYGSVSKFLHWLIALSVIAMLLAGMSFSYLPKSEFRHTLVYIHKSAGITILGLMIIRLLWRWINTTPALPQKTARWEHSATHIVQYLFYITVIAIPVTGVVMSVAGGHPLPFWWIANVPLPFIPANTGLSHTMYTWHGYLAWTIAGLIVIHTLAALKHHFVNKDDVLKRMMPK